MKYAVRIVGDQKPTHYLEDVHSGARIPFKLDDPDNEEATKKWLWTAHQMLTEFVKEHAA